MMTVRTTRHLYGTSEERILETCNEKEESLLSYRTSES